MHKSLAELLTQDRIINDLQAADRWQAIDELLTRLIHTGAIQAENRVAIAAVVRKREQSMSTGIGFGIGIPHATTDCISQAVAALGRSSRGIAFDALDGQPVNLVVLFLVPQGELQQHLHTMAGIAKLLQHAEIRQALRQAPDAAAVLQLIRHHEARRATQTIHP
jgi:mannitol/fructose-specific phosphotransferase system IIA component (Ntr-type)